MIPILIIAQLERNIARTESFIETIQAINPYRVSWPTHRHKQERRRQTPPWDVFCSSYNKTKKTHLIGVFVTERIFIASPIKIL